MAWSVQCFELDIAQIQNIPFIHSEEFVMRCGTCMQDILCLSKFCKFAPSGDVVGMNVSIDHVAGLHAVLFGYL